LIPGTHDRIGPRPDNEQRDEPGQEPDGHHPGPRQYSRHVWIMDALPKGATGRIVKRDIVIPADLAVLGLPRPSATAP